MDRRADDVIDDHMGDDIVAFLLVGLVDAADLSLALSSARGLEPECGWMQHTTAENQQQQPNTELSW